jgi:hypothetical protein
MNKNKDVEPGFGPPNKKGITNLNNANRVLRLLMTKYFSRVARERRLLTPDEEQEAWDELRLYELRYPEFELAYNQNPTDVFFAEYETVKQGFLTQGAATNPSGAA